MFEGELSPPEICLRRTWQSPSTPGTALLMSSLESHNTFGQLKQCVKFMTIHSTIVSSCRLKTNDSCIPFKISFPNQRDQLWLVKHSIESINFHISNYSEYLHSQSNTSTITLSCMFVYMWLDVTKPVCIIQDFFSLLLSVIRKVLDNPIYRIFVKKSNFLGYRQGLKQMENIIKHHILRFT